MSPIIEVNYVHSQLYRPRYVTIGLLLFGVMVAWLLAVHVSLPLCARAQLTLLATRELFNFHHRLASSEGHFRFSSDGWVRLPHGQHLHMACIWATPWLLVFASQDRTYYLHLWRYGLPDYHFRLIFRHCCQRL
ncbi:hypothetical protein [Salinivibrio sp. ES.052]|uniref:hypothetical protein n=1 Tax=Salinivibrio sp. ES.052 TaxID=1882823 RepID=UPI00111518FD|nr:hypothetical protein [Salinivibrio sp. ES.052]